MSTLNLPRKIIDDMLPTLISAARYAESLQPIVQNQSGKGGNIIQDALTDADIAIQNMIEVALLGMYPTISFYGEEFKNSINAKYFPTESEYEVLLDPIDGTKFYQDGKENFQILLSITNKQQFETAIAVYPKYHSYVFAEKGKGAWRGSFANNSLDKCEMFRLNPRTEKIMVGSRSKVKLSDEFESFCILDMYSKDSKVCNLGDLLTGGVAGLVTKDASFIDWGAIAFIAKESGATLSQWDGSPLPAISECRDRRFPNLLVCADNNLHSKLLKELSSSL
jgi:myo-inositol-1(or 4)-monophosphatase